MASENTKLDLATANILVVGERASEQDIVAQMLMGFGVPGIQRRTTPEEGMIAALAETFDLCLIDAGTDGRSYQTVSEMRRQNKDCVRYLPIIIVRGHVRKSDLFQARDCGANFVITKPLSPQVLFDRIVWLARDARQFVECDTYAGPDRRVKAFGPPVGMKGRRRDDLSEHIGAAKEANLSQDAVDDFFGAKKVSL
jgi:DNA-binding response OmpR family regulator